MRSGGAGNIVGLPLTRDVLIQSILLPAEPHDDPADRTLLAQAQLGGMPLPTSDRLAAEYTASQPDVPVLMTSHDPRGSAALGNLPRSASPGAVGARGLRLGGTRYLPRESGQFAQLRRPAEGGEQKPRHAQVHVQRLPM